MKYPGSASAKGGGQWKSVKDDVYSFSSTSEIFFMFKLNLKIHKIEIFLASFLKFVLFLY